jgi:hypothetical protein
VKHVVLAAVLLLGCIPHTIVTVEGDARSARRLPGAAGAVSVETRTYDGAVLVRVRWPRTCAWRITDDETVSRATRADLVGTRDGDQWGYALTPIMAILFPITIANVAGAELYAAGAGTTVTHARVELVTLRAPCDAPASHVVVHLTLRSGGRIDVTTDARGEAAFLLPADEPEGDVVATVDRLPPPVDAAPVLPPPPDPPLPALQVVAPSDHARSGFGGVRDVAQACGRDLGLTATVKITLSIAASGSISSASSDQGGIFDRCLATNLAAVAFPARSSPQTLTIPFRLVGAR